MNAGQVVARRGRLLLVRKDSRWYVQDDDSPVLRRVTGSEAAEFMASADR